MKLEEALKPESLRGKIEKRELSSREREREGLKV